MTKPWGPQEEAREIRSPEVGKVLFGTKYLIVAKLGRGGMGEVFEVVKPPQIMGVLKRLAPEMAKFPKAKELFLTEVRALAELDHPHIVRVQDFDTDGFGVPFMVMERLTGRNVAALTEKRGRVEPDEAYEITRQLLDALHVAHTHDTPVVHRDIKPENIFLHQPRHGEPVLKLIDFGLVAEAGTQEKDFAGSIHYAAPEQILGEPVTGSADLYAVGGVLYEMLSGRMPYDAPTATEVGRAKVKHKPKPLAKLAPWVPEPVARLVLQALEREPEKRPPSAKAFREALDAAVGYRAPNEAVRGRAAIPAVTKVRVPPPGGKGRTAPMPSGAGSASFSDDTLLKAGLPSRPVRLGELWLEIVAGLVVGLVMLGLVHAMVSP